MMQLFSLHNSIRLSKLNEGLTGKFIIVEEYLPGLYWGEQVIGEDKAETKFAESKTANKSTILQYTFFIM